MEEAHHERAGEQGENGEVLRCGEQPGALEGGVMDDRGGRVRPLCSCFGRETRKGGTPLSDNACPHRSLLRLLRRVHVLHILHADP